MAEERGTLGALLLGMAIGATIGLLYAPEKGEKTRKRIAKASGPWGERANEVLESAGEVVEKSRKRFGI